MNLLIIYIKKSIEPDSIIDICIRNIIMFKRQKICKAKASIISILSCIEKGGMQRNFKGEDSAYITAYNDYNRQSYYILNNRDETHTRYKERLYEYTEDHWGNFIKDNEWSGEPQLYSFQKWYEIKVLIKYIIDGVEYSKTVTVNNEDEHLPNDFLYIIYNIDNPEEILSVNVYDIDEFSVFPLVLMCSFLIIVILILVMIYMVLY